MTTLNPDCRFTYPSVAYPYRAEVSDITYAQAAGYIDLCGQLGINAHPFHTASGWVDGSRAEAAGTPFWGMGPAIWETCKATRDLVANWPRGWRQDVSAVLAARSKAALEEKLIASYEAVAHPAIRAFLLARGPAARGAREAQATDLSSWCQLAARSNMGNGKPVYEPAGEAKARLLLKEAVGFSYSQESYADHIEHAVPVVLEAGADLDICRQNLHRFCAALRTHNGFAGSGSTYSAELVVNDLGAFAIFNQRASISD